MGKRILWVALVCGILVVLMAAVFPASSAGLQERDIWISEVVASNALSLADDAYGSPDWIELYNASDRTVNLAGYGLSKSVKNPYVFTFPEVQLQPGEHIVVYACEMLPGVEQGLCTGFRIPKTGVELLLTDAMGTIVQKLTVPALYEDVSYGIDGNGRYLFYGQPTPGALNEGLSAQTLETLLESDLGGIRINEVLPRPGKEQGYGWVELRNTSARAIDLGTYFITDSVANPDKASLPDVTLQPGEYLLLPFSESGLEGSLPFSIGQQENLLRIYDQFGGVVDELSWDLLIFEDVSVGLAENGERHYFEEPTPGTENSTAYMETEAFVMQEGMPEVYINELLRENTYSLIDGEGDRSPWIELYNGSDRAVSLKGYYLSDDVWDPYKWALPDIKLQPGSYLIIFASGKDLADEELHTGFRLGNSDTHLLLTDRHHQTVQTVTLPEERDNVAYGLNEEGQWRYYPQPTPERPNTTKGFETLADAASYRSQGICINEVSSVQKAKSGLSDWVELYNGSDSAINLKGYYLSDSKTVVQKWAISGTLQAKGYLVIRTVKEEGQTAELSLATAGETLYLTDENGQLVDSFATGALRVGTSAGLDASGQRTVFLTPTPGWANSTATASGYCQSPAFSKQGGYYSDTVELSIEGPAGATVYYTTDGSTPTEASVRYTGPISISKTTTVRAIAVQAGKLASDETVATYLMGKRHTLPVVCLSMTQNDWTYVLGSEKRTDIRERNGYVEYYEADGTLGIAFPAGFRTAGNSSRVFAQKNINMYLRGGYGRSSVEYPFFDDYDITNFKSLSLRNTGQDINYTRLRDAYFSMVVNGLHIDNMQTKFVVVYLNGQYWGLYELKENQNEDYMEARYGVDREKVGYARNNSDVFNNTGSATIKNLFAQAKGDLSNDALFKQFTSKISVEHFTDYLIVQTYTNNVDMYNQKYAGSDDGELKWRPVYYDLDWGMMEMLPSNMYSMYIFFNENGIPIGQPKEDGTRFRVDTSLYYGLYKNAGWRQQFVERYAEVLNTVLSTERMLALFDEMVEQVRGEMPATIARWGQPTSMAKWNAEVKKLRDCIAQRRPYGIKQLKNFFHLSDAEIKRLFPND